MEIASERTPEERSNQDKVDEAVFKNAYIPRTLTEVSHYERDVDSMMKIKDEDASLNTQHDTILYQTVTGLKKDLSGVQTVPSLLEHCSKDGSSASEEEEEEEEGEDDSSAGEEEGAACGSTPLDRKERKKLVKEAQREKRKNKVPKHVKKRKEKIAKRKKGR